MPVPDLAEHLASVDTATLSDHELLEHLADTERLIAWATSLQLAAAADFARRPQRLQAPGEDVAAVSAGWSRPGRWVREYADDELAARLCISRVDASGRIALGCALVGLPATRIALAEGRIDGRRARVLVEETRALDAATAREVEAAVIETAQRVPAARLRPKVKAAVVRADPAAAHERTQSAVAERRVVITPAADGMAQLWALLPAANAMAMQTALNAAARASKAAAAPGDDRTMDQRRADALCAPFQDAVASGELAGTRLARHRGRAIEVQVTVAASTLLGLDDEPAVLAGYGPITAPTARELAGDARWRRILTDPASGTVLDVGTSSYAPSAALARHVEIRDQYCTFPGCGARAVSCELDHVVAFPHGPTADYNLGPRCKRHHLLKHSGAVRLQRLGDGTSRWTFPTGHVYDVPPTPIAAPVEQPRTEQPRTEEPRTEQPRTEQPRTEELRTEEPGTDEPTHEPGPTEQRADDPGTTDDPSP